MKLVSDAKDYSHDHGGFSLALLSISVLLLFVLPLYLVIMPPESLIAIRPVLIAEAAGSIVVLFTLALFLKSSGMLLNVPLKVYEEGVLIQPILSTMPKTVPFQSVSSMEIFRSGNGKGGCSLLSLDGGRLRSVEPFLDAMKAKEFVARILPVMEAEGFIASIEEDERSCSAVFRRVKSPPSASALWKGNAL